MKQTIYLGMTLIDGNGNAPRENAYVQIERDRITGIGSANTAPVSGATVVDCSGRYMIPGVIDVHAHGGLDGNPDCMKRAAAASEAATTITYLNSLRGLLSDGVVLFREMGTKHHVDIAVSAAVAAGDVIGPDIVPCGNLITMTGGHCWALSAESDGVDGVIKAVRAQIKAGAKAIKFMATGGLHTPGNRTTVSQLNLDELTAGVKEAHKCGLVTGAHCFGASAARDLLAAGIDSIEHGCFLGDDPEVFSIMKEKGTYYVPTLYCIAVLAEANPSLGLDAALVGKAVPAHQRHIGTFQLALEKGVKMAFGTDRGTTLNRHESGSIEMVLLQKYGMQAMDIIQSFSKNASELLGLSADYGTLEIGKKANFILLGNNPLCDISVMTGQKSVYKNGIQYF